MRILAASLALALVTACTTSAPPPTTAPPPPVYGFTLEEEGRILEMEDRREFDVELAVQWIRHPNALHRSRMALALGRIGPHAFVDVNRNGQRDPGEKRAGVDLLTELVQDSSAAVRETAAFALGEIGDSAGAEALLRLAADANAAVAGEAVEAASKLSAHVPFATYATFLGEAQPEGVRARAYRFLFRYDSDEASAAAAAALDHQSKPVREAAAYALARRAYPPARERLELLVNDPSLGTRMYAIAALGRIGDPESLSRLFQALRDDYPWVRTNALVAISRVAAKTPEAITRRDLARDAGIIANLTDDPDPGTRASAVETLGWYAARHDAAKTKLREVMTSGSRWIRELATGAWARHVGDTSPATGWEKVRAVEGRWDARYARDPDPMVRAAVISNIPEDKLDANEPLVMAGLEDADVVVRANAAEKYAKLRSRSIEVLEAQERRGRGEAMNDARLAAISALGEIDYPRREAFLRALLGDEDPVVRRVAADIIEQKLARPRPQYAPFPATRPAAEYQKIAEWARGRHTAAIRMTRGTVRVALLTQDAPMTAWNFAQLAEKGYFDGTSFMRVVPNFVIQGGDPRNDMNGGPGYAIRDEINLQKYTRGAVGMALSGPDTGGSQFFVTHSPQPHLDGGYTIFGRVVDGLSAVVDQTERGDRVETIVVDGK